MTVLIPRGISSATNLRLLSSLLRPVTVLDRPQLRPQRRAAYRPLIESQRPLPVKSIATSTQNFSTSTLHAHNDSSQSSVSSTEISHFSRLASSWWDPHGPSRLLHLMNPHRHTFISTSLSSIIPLPQNPNQKGLKYLDVGCGGGIFAESAARLANTHSVTAIDPTPSVLAVANEHQRNDPALSPPKLNYLNTAIEGLPIPTSNQDRVDIITLFEVLEHIDRPSTFLESCIPHLKRGGWIIGSTIARSPLSFLTTKLIAEAPLIGVVPRGTHDWNKYINPDELEEWFEKRSRQGEGEERWGNMKKQGVVYVPGFGWKMVPFSEALGNYFFGVQRLVG